MRLLFDENLSHRLVDLLADVYPDSVHVRDIGLASATDLEVARYASDVDLVIVTKDIDFEELGLASSHQPRIIRLAIGNSSTADVERILRSVATEVEALSATSRVVTIQDRPAER